MYQFFKKVDSILHYHFHKNDLITIKGNQSESYLTLLNDELAVKDKLSETTAYDFVVYNNSIFITKCKAYESYYVNFEDGFKEVRKLQYGMNIKGHQKENKYICSGIIDNVKHFLLLDLKNGKLINKIPMNTGFGFVDLLLSDNLILSATDDKLGVFSLSNQELWQHDIHDIFNSESDGEIKELKKYQNNIIVTSTEGIASIEIPTGKINWATTTYADTIEIINNIGYICTSLSLYKVNLDSGEIIDYDGWEFSRLPDFEFNGKTYSPSGHRVIYNEGLLWYVIHNSGESFILAINPTDGYSEWIHHIETSEKIHSVKFHQNKMFILNNNNELYVYEKN